MELRGLRVVNVERATADLLCSSRPQDGIAVADEVLRMAGKHHERARRAIARRIAARADPRGTVRAMRLLVLASPRAESPPESRLRLVLVEEGFPVPEVNHWVHDLDGRRLWRVDLAWPDLRIAIEYDGYEAHVGRAEEDEARAADLRQRGWIVIRVDKHDIRALYRVLRELEAAFALRGYPSIRRPIAG
ncbi:endonuclease domain-containing protein [Pseudonocardia sp. CA-107938]|uniref:endonuclease domain-containing protein n=1 Tax=Pseudonocardia sp. CA-107938 TaxID=3240021 RepID=UPI003D91D9FD